VLRAFTGAKLYLSGAGLTLTEAANCCGSCPQYVHAAATVLLSENDALVDDVLAGRIAILTAAKMAAPLAALMAAFRKASPQALTAFSVTTGLTDDLVRLALRSGPEQRAEIGRILGPETVWEEMVLPQLAKDNEAVTTTVTQPSVSVTDFGDEAEAADWWKELMNE